MPKNPAYQWYPKDYRADPVSTCSIAAQGLWRSMLDMMYLSERRGYLEENGKPLPDEVIAKYCYCKNVEEYRMLLAELRLVGVPKMDERGVFYSKRLLEVIDTRKHYAEVKQEQRQEVKDSLEAPAEKNGDRPRRSEVEGFEDFYSAYPKKPGPEASRKIWRRRVRVEDVPRIMEAIERFKSSREWLKDDGQYIPLPSTFLSQRRWEAQLEMPAGSNPVRLKPPE